jgi:hypothetical protein
MGRDAFRKVSRFVVRFLTATILVSAFFVAIQDFLVFPGLYSSLVFGGSAPVAGVDVLQAVAADGTNVTVWRVRSDEKTELPPALVFHGNAENLGRFLQMQKWLASLGITSYAVEYRGYAGLSSGWPSEEGFYLDGEAAFKLLQAEEHVEANKVIVLGSSIGTGTAAYVAERYKAGTLVLLSPYSSLTEVASETPFLGYLVRFLKYRFPTSDLIKRMSDTCVVAAHGKQDSTIPFHHSEALKGSYAGTKQFTLIASEQAGHNDVMRYLHQEVANAIVRCVRGGRNEH